MGTISQMYIGYKDRTFVPYRNLKKAYLAKGVPTEEHVRGALCMAQKIGNGAEGCSVVFLPEKTEAFRSAGWLKRNQYAYKVIATVLTEDLYTYDRLIEKKLGVTPSSASSNYATDAESCTLGFCD